MTAKSLECSKEELIAEIDRRIEDKIIEQTNADLLKKLINNADTLTEAVAIAELGTTYRRTGLHFDKRLEKFSDTIKYFKKNEDLSFKTNEKGLTHKLIIGDNYDALSNLLIEYRGMIDVIYIDPPYGKDSMGEFAETNYDNAITRDNLLSMLYPRLEFAKQLLSENGIIFCSIDDKNQAYIKCLFDEIFGEKNFVETFINKSNPRGNQAKKFTASEHEYILCYAYDKTQILPLGFTKDEVEFSSEDEHGKYNATGLRKRGAGSAREDAPNEFYPIYFNPETGEITVENNGDGFVEILPKLSNGKDGRWRWARENIAKKNRFLEAKKVKRNGTEEWDIFVKKYYTGEEIKKIRSIFYEKEVNNEEGTEELRSIFGNKVFSYPKPVYTIKKLIDASSRKDSIILDFFAGSGTTGHAVLSLNKDDGGTRQFIVVTNNEINDINPNGIAYDATSKRLKRIMTGRCYDGDKDFSWIKNNEPYGDNLDVYEIETVASFESSNGKTPFDTIDETLYGKEKMSPKDKIKWVCENFDNTQKYVENDNDYKKRIEGAE